LFAESSLALKTKDLITYSASSEADYRAVNVSVHNGNYYFDMKFPDGEEKQILLPMPGRHNIENAVAAFAVANNLGVSSAEIKAALGTFKGVKRRFEYIIKNEEQVFIDDYAHHPQELKACITAVKELYPEKKITGVFQPHLFSRTRDFAAAFATALSLLDEVILLPIYPARELPIEGISSDIILKEIKTTNKKLCYKNELFGVIENSTPQVLLTLGAGDIDALVEPIKEILQNK
jgi:UDP-N-acetylmuramate--alanine ligase